VDASFSSFLRAEEKDSFFGPFQKGHLSGDRKKMNDNWQNNTTRHKVKLY
jgi:hypothetical protein